MTFTSNRGSPGRKVQEPIPSLEMPLKEITVAELLKPAGYVSVHIDDFNCDEALGLFAGLNIPPKKSFATDYSYRTTRQQQLKLLKSWTKQLSPIGA